MVNFSQLFSPLQLQKAIIQKHVSRENDQNPKEFYILTSDLTFIDFKVLHEFSG